MMTYLSSFIVGKLGVQQLFVVGYAYNKDGGDRFRLERH
jgi:hypothetical protein